MILNPFGSRSDGGDNTRNNIMPGGSLIPGLGGIGNPTGMNNQPGGIPGVNNKPPMFNGGLPIEGNTNGTAGNPLGGSPNTATPVVGAPVTNQPASTIPGTTGTDGTDITGSNIGAMLGFNNPAIEAQLNNLYGNGVGTALYQYLAGGAGYNPAVAKALLAQNKPLEQQGRANVEEAFGAAGNRDSSSAALGLSNFESNFQLGQSGQLANLYQNSANNYANMFGGVINTAQLEEANKKTTLDTLSQIAGLLGGTQGGGILGLLQKLLGKGKGGASGSGGAGSSGGNNKNNGGQSPSAPSLIPGAPQLPVDPSTQALLDGLGISPDAWTAVQQMLGGGGDASTLSGAGDILSMFPIPSDPNLAGYGGSTSITDIMPTGPDVTTSTLPDYIPMDSSGGGDMGGF